MAGSEQKVRHRDINKSMSVVAAVPASTVVLLRPGHLFEVFLVRRSDSIAFMGGAHVFPGGRVDAGDYIDHIETTIDGMPSAVARMPDVPPEAATAHHVAALRERLRDYTHGGRSTEGLVLQVEPRVQRGEQKVEHPGDGIRKISPTQFEMVKTNWRPTRDLQVLILEPAVRQ